MEKRQVNVSEQINKSKLNKWHIIIFLIGLLIIILNGYNQSIYGIALPYLMEDTGIDTAVFGLIGTYCLIGMFIGSIFFGVLADKIGRVNAAAIGIILFSVGSGMFGFGNTALEFAIYRIVAGIGMAGVVPVTIPIISEYSPSKYTPLLTSVVTSGVPIGGIITPLIATAVLPVIGWRPMYLSCFIPLVVLIILYALVPESMERYVKRGRKDKIVKTLARVAPEFKPQENDEYLTNSTSTSGKRKAGLKDLFTNGMAKTTLMFWLAFICSMFFTYGMQTWLPSIMMQAGFPITSSMMFMVAYACGSIPSIALSGKLVEKFGYKRSVMGLMCLAGLALGLLAVRPSETIMYILLFLAGTGMYGETAIFYSYLSMSYPNAIRSTAVGFCGGVARLGGALGPVVGGMLVAAGASVSVDLIVFAIPMFIAAICIGFTREYVEA